MVRRIQRTIWAVGLSLALVGVLAAAGFSAPTVMVNGQALAGGDKLVVIENAMLLPMQTVANALGAQSDYRANEQHKIILTRGNDTLNLWLGSTMATVNGKPVTADVSPTMVGLTIYVPLRVAVQSFGGSVQYDPVSGIAYVNIAQVPGPGGPTQPPGQTVTLQGEVLQVYLGVTTSLMIRDATTNATSLIALAAQCQILRGAAGQVPTVAQPGDLRTGDQVQVTVTGGLAVRIIATAPGSGQQLQHMRVQIVGVAGKYLLLPDGKSLLVADNASILDENGQAIALNALRPQDQVVVIFDTVQNTALSITREASAGPPAADTAPPRFVALTPTLNATIQNSSPIVETRFADDHSGINKAATTMTFDGQDVTAQCEVGDDYIRCQAVHLADGLHQVDVNITDNAGNTSRNQWAFTVQAPADKQILIVSHNGEQTLGAGAVLKVTAKVARPGGTITCAIGTFKEGLAMRQVGQSNTYTHSYKVRAGNKVTARIKVTYTPPQGQPVVAYSQADAVIDGGVVPTLKVTKPKANATVGKEMVVSGTATAGYRVRVNVKFNKKRLLDMSHDLPQQIVTAGADGKWETAPFEMEHALFDKADTYDIKAELLAPAVAGQEDTVIATAKLTVKGK